MAFNYFFLLPFDVLGMVHILDPLITIWCSRCTVITPSGEPESLETLQESESKMVLPCIFSEALSKWRVAKYKLVMLLPTATKISVSQLCCFEY